MRIDDDLIGYLEALSKLRLEDAERETVKADLGRILSYMDQLAELEGNGDLAYADDEPGAGAVDGAARARFEGNADTGTDDPSTDASAQTAQSTASTPTDMRAAGVCADAMPPDAHAAATGMRNGDARSAPGAGETPRSVPLREDIPRDGLARDALLAAAPHHKDGRIVAPKTME